MKHIKWFKTLCLSVTPVAAICPIVLTSTSCSSTRVLIDNYTYATLKSAVDSGNDTFTTYTSSSVDYKDLLIGHKKITDGNYVLIVGSNSMNTTCKFFTKGEFRIKKNWYTQFFQDSLLYCAVNDDVEKKEKIPFTFFNVIDECPKEYYDKTGHRIHLSKDGQTETTYIKPYEKWDNTLITNTYKFNSVYYSYEWDKDSVKADTDLVRFDASAVAYRAFNDLGAKLWPVDEKAEPKRTKTFQNADGDSSRIVMFKNGKIVHIDELPTTSSALATLINTHYNKPEN